MDVHLERPSVYIFFGLQGSKVVFHDPKEIVVDGQATKQITLTSTGEVKRESFVYTGLLLTF